MATSGAYSGSAFNFSYLLVKASDPTAFFTGSFTAGDVKVVKRTGSTCAAATNITTLPTHQYEGVFKFQLSATEMTADEVTIVINAASADVVDEAISIVTEPTPSDVLEVASASVSGVADFKATGFSTFNPASDTVANVTTVGSVSGSVGSVVAAVTAGTVSDKTGYSISGSLTTLDALDTAQDSQHSTTQSAISGLNNISASDVYTEFTSGSNEDVFKANVSGLATASALATVDTEVGQIKAKTDQLTFTVSNQVDANALTGGGGGGGATSSNQTTIINHLTDIKGAGWTSTDNLAEITEDVTGLNGDAMRGTDGASTTTPPTAAAIYSEFTSGSNEDAFKADVSGLATASALSTVDSNVDAILVDTGTTLPSTLSTIEGKVDTVDTNVDSVLADTGTTIPSTLSTIEGKIDTVDNNVDAVLVDTGTTLPSTLSTIEGKVDVVDSNVDAVLVDTGTTIPATLSTMDGKIDTLDTVADSILSDTGTDGVVLSTATLNSIADAILKRDVDNVEATANEHTLATIILCILESSRSSTTWTIKRSDGATTHVTKTLTLNASAQPVTGVQ